MSESDKSKIMSVKTDIHITKDQKEINKFQHLVFSRYCLDRGWFNPENYPEKMMLDKFDQYSTFVLVYKESNLVGGTRLVRDSKFGFPHEFAVGNQLPKIEGQTEFKVREKLLNTPRYKIMEATKTVGTSNKNMFSKDLAKILYWYGIYQDIEAYYEVIDIDFFKLCHKVHAPVHPIGTPGFIDGSWSIPGILFTDELGANIKANDPVFWSYINDKSNLLGDWEK